MNTKQLWNALTLNPITNKYFDGIFSIDTLKDIKEKPTLIIIIQILHINLESTGFCFSFMIIVLIFLTH